MKHRLTRLADEDIANTLRETLRLFGREQVLRYAEIIQPGIEMVAEAPARPSSHARDEISPGVRSFHLDLVRNRRKSAAHTIYYHVAADRDGADELVVLRILHERMEPLPQLSRALRGTD